MDCQTRQELVNKATAGLHENLLCHPEEILQGGASTPIATIAPTVLDQIYREIDSPPPKIRVAPWHCRGTAPTREESGERNCFGSLTNF